jgi:hypothetical protein
MGNKDEEVEGGGKKKRNGERCNQKRDNVRMLRRGTENGNDANEPEDQERKSEKKD